MVKSCDKGRRERTGGRRLFRDYPATVAAMSLLSNRFSATGFLLTAIIDCPSCELVITEEECFIRPKIGRMTVYKRLTQPVEDFTPLHSKKNTLFLFVLKPTIF